MQRLTSFAVFVVLVAFAFGMLPTRAANDVLLRRNAGTVGYRLSPTSALITVTGTQAVADDSYASTGTASVGIVIFPDSSLVTLGSSTTIKVGAFRVAESGSGSTIQVPSTGGALRFEVRHPTGGRSNYNFSTSIMNIAVRGTVALLSDTPTGDTLACLDCRAGDVVATVGGRDYALLTGQTMRVTPNGNVVIDVTTDAVLQNFSNVGLPTNANPPAGTEGVAHNSGNGLILPVAAAVAIGAVAAGGHGGSSASVGTAGPGPTPTPGPSPTNPPNFGPVILNPSFVAIPMVGGTAMVTASQSGNTANTFTVGAPVVCPGSGAGTVVQTSPGNFTVTSQQTSSGRVCTVTITGLGNISSTLGMTL